MTSFDSFVKCQHIVSLVRGLKNWRTGSFDPAVEPFAVFGAIKALVTCLMSPESHPNEYPNPRPKTLIELRIYWHMRVF